VEEAFSSLEAAIVDSERHAALLERQLMEYGEEAAAKFGEAAWSELKVREAAVITPAMMQRRDDAGVTRALWEYIQRMERRSPEWSAVGDHAAVAQSVTIASTLYPRLVGSLRPLHRWRWRTRRGTPPLSRSSSSGLRRCRATRCARSRAARTTTRNRPSVAAAAASAAAATRVARRWSCSEG
jgi:hypothetical protein